MLLLCGRGLEVQFAQHFEDLDILRMGGSKEFTFGQRFREETVSAQLGNEGLADVSARGSQFDGLLVPIARFGVLSPQRQRSSQLEESVDVVGLARQPLFAVGRQSGQIVAAEERILDTAADVPSLPATRFHLFESQIEQRDGRLGLAMTRVQLRNLNFRLEPAVRVVLRQGSHLFPTADRLVVLVFLRQQFGQFFENAPVVGEPLRNLVPRLQSCLVLLLTHLQPAQLLVQVEQLGTRRIPLDRPGDGERCFIELELTCQQRSAEQRWVVVVRSEFLGPGESCGSLVFNTSPFRHETEQNVDRGVLRRAVDLLFQRTDQLVQLARVKVVAVPQIERRSSTWAALKDLTVTCREGVESREVLWRLFGCRCRRDGTACAL